MKQDKNVARIKNACLEAFKKMSENQAFQKIVKGDISVEEYKSLLREIYFYTRETPQMAAQMTVHLRGQQRDAIRGVLKHSVAEVGHHEIAAQDLQKLGEDITDLPYERPLPATLSFISYGYYQTQHMDPVGLMGIMYFLEYLPTVTGGSLVESLVKAGVPVEATRFIKEHAVLDISHLKTAEEDIRKLATSNNQVENIIYSIFVTAELYIRLVEAAISNPNRTEIYRSINSQEFSESNIESEPRMLSAVAN